jgi:hypothetical protein
MRSGRMLVRRRISSLPLKDGAYLAHEKCLRSFCDRKSRSAVDAQSAGSCCQERSESQDDVKKIFAEWDLVAMAAASLSDDAPGLTTLLIYEEEHTWLPNRHNWQPANLAAYLSGDSGWLLPIAHMARLVVFRA